MSSIKQICQISLWILSTLLLWTVYFETLFLLPLYFFIERKMAKPEVTQGVNTEYNFLAFSLYSYHSTKNAQNPPAEADGDVTPNCSLSLITTDLKPNQDAELQHFLSKKMTKGSLNEDSSHIGNVDISVESEAESSDDPKQVNALCYYRLVPKSASPLSLSLEGEESAQSSHYMICLLASTDALLDLFRPDLDAFCCQLVVQLNSFDPLLSFEDTDCIEKEAQRLLCNWYQTTATYLCSCLAKFNSNIKFIIYASVMNAKVEVRGADDELCTQVERFVKCCSLSEMLNSSEMSGSGSGDILLVDTKVMAESTSHTSPLIIEFKDGAFTFSNHACTKYCEDWAMALTQGDMNNPAYLKQVIDNYKLKAIQDLNTLKRHVRQAEASHYSLFKCLTYLQSCGNEAVLMRLAQNELQSSSESSSVLSVLNEYIQENSHQI